MQFDQPATRIVNINEKPQAGRQSQCCFATKITYLTLNNSSAQIVH